MERSGFGVKLLGKEPGDMDSPLIIPLVCFGAVALIVGIITVARLRDKEVGIQQNLHFAALEHERRMQELQAELDRLKGSKPAPSPSRL